MRKSLLVLLPLFLVTAAVAQNPPEKPPEFSFMEDEVMLNSSAVICHGGTLPEDAKERCNNLAAEYLKSAKDARVVQYQLAQANERFYYGTRGRGGTGTSAAQISQVCDENSTKLQLLQVAQNQRIIELLEKLANKPGQPKP